MQNTINLDLVGKKTIIDKIVRIIFLAITVICASMIALITIFILVKGSLPFINEYEVNGTNYRVNIFYFLTGNKWSSPNLYGAGFIVLNTIYVTILALVISVPISVLTALFISRIAPKKVGIILNTVIELLASIPSVIYGLFGRGFITNLVKNIAKVFGVQTAGGLSTLSAALVLAMMILPTITMISVTAINSVKKELIHGSLALGASITQTNFKVVLISAKSGIFSGIILGVGRALGEATAVSMVCGNSISNFSFNLFDTTSTLTSTMLLGLHESTGLSYDIRFSVGILLIVIILVTNLLLNFVKNRIGKK